MLEHCFGTGRPFSSRHHSAAWWLVMALVTQSIEGIRIALFSNVTNGDPLNVSLDRAAVEQALEDARNQGFAVNVEVVEKPTPCEEASVLRELMMMLGVGDPSLPRVDAFFGPPCSCSKAGKISASMVIPMFLPSCMDSISETGFKDAPPIRTAPFDNQIFFPLLATIQHFKWSRVAVVYDVDNRWSALARFVIDNLRSNSVMVKDIQLTSVDEQSVRNVSKDIKQDARIVIVLTSIVDGISLARYFELVDMKNPEYVLILIDIDGHLYFSPKGSWSWLIPMVPEERRRWQRMYAKYGLIWPDHSHLEPIYNKTDWIFPLQSILRSALILLPKQPKIENVERFVESLAKLEAPTRNRTISIQAVVTALRTYDSVRLYLNQVRRSFSSDIGSKFRSDTGSKLILALRGTTYESQLGYWLHLDRSGDLLMNASLVMFHHTQLKLLGDFVLDQNMTSNETQALPRLVPRPFVKMEWPGGMPPPDTPECGFNSLSCKEKSWVKFAVGCSLTFTAVIVFCFPFIIYKQRKIKRKITSQLWRIEFDQLQFQDLNNDCNASTVSLTQQEYNNMFEFGIGRHKFTTVAFYKGNIVAVKAMPKWTVDLNKTVLTELRQMWGTQHANLNPFIGACVTPGHIMLVTQYGSKGSLRDILDNESMKLDTLFILSLVFDLVKGMVFLHSSEIRSHGSLKSTNCVVDSRWVLKITDYGLHTFKHPQDGFTDGSIRQQRSPVEHLQWTAPELLRMNHPPPNGTQRGDVYSFGIILQECHDRRPPWGNNNCSPEVVLHRVRMVENPPFRPVVLTTIEKASELRSIMESCWSEQPEARPMFVDLKKSIHAIMENNDVKSNIFDNMMYKMEKYTQHLEYLVSQKTGELIEEKRKTDALLERMLPHPVADQLKRGRSVEAESFDAVTIYFSDIVGFTALCAESTPMQVVNFLNALYTTFDEITRRFNVYKVETIGDAYMVVSGLPIRNGNQHAGEICRMALVILDSLQNFVVPHRENYQLKVRIGVHTGPVVAGVVGTTMPRYCLFGDTVNVAARMENSGEALRIHTSVHTKMLLDYLGGFQTQFRTEIEVKGKGAIRTYWLLSYDENNVSPSNDGIFDSTTNLMSLTDMSSLAKLLPNDCSKSRKTSLLQFNVFKKKHSSGKKSPTKKLSAASALNAEECECTYLLPSGLATSNGSHNPGRLSKESSSSIPV